MREVICKLKIADMGQKERILKVIPELEKNVKEITRKRVDNRIERRLGRC